MMVLLRWLLTLCALALLASARADLAGAHELRPGYLEITERSPGVYDTRFKVPARGEMRLRLYPRYPESCSNLAEPHTEKGVNAWVDRRLIRCPGGLAGESITIDGLAGTVTDVVARVASADGNVQTVRLTPDRPYFDIARSPDWDDTARTYFVLGVEHILLGADHLLFVLALLLLVRSIPVLVKTITAFTAAHSITLAAASLGWAQAPQPPMEALIALSIVFAAAEIVRGRHGRASLLRQAPWLAAFAFGLLHGFGFGGALKEIGLPQADVPLALLTFNLGVEAGQLLFIAAVLALQAGVGRFAALRIRPFRTGLEPFPTRLVQLCRPAPGASARRGPKSDAVASVEGRNAAAARCGPTRTGRALLAGLCVAHPRICCGMSFVLAPEARPKSLRQSGPIWSERALAYAIGYVAVFWFVERLWAMP